MIKFPKIWRGRSIGLAGLLLVLMGCLVLGSVSKADVATVDESAVFLNLEDYIRLVLQRNETLQIRILAMEMNRRLHLAEKGIFEPEFVFTYDYVETKRENTAEEQRSQRIATFDEKNNIYSGGIESLLPSGARIRLGYTMRDLKNNLGGFNIFNPLSSDFTNQYSTFVGLNLTQPLLKNGGRAASMANIRLAALASDIAFQEYRRQLMLLISTAEAAYWNLYMAQEQLLFFRESVGLAETILSDNKERLNAGKGSSLEILESEAALALRKSRQSEALQAYFEAANRLTTLYSESVIRTNRMIVAIEEPLTLQYSLDFLQSWQNAFDLNPDYLTQQIRILQENVRLAFTKNQRWPQLDLKASYGVNGLGETPWDSWDDVERRDFPSWSMGVELRIPLMGGLKPKYEYDAAWIRQKSALLALQELETQIANSLDTALRKVTSSHRGVQSYKTAVVFSQNLLDTQLARLDVGKVESRKVLETEADLFEVKNSVVQAMVTFRRALLELGLIEGSILKSRNLDISRQELESRTVGLVRNGNITEAQYQAFIRGLQYEYHKNARFEIKPGQKMKWISGPDAPMSEEDYQRAKDLLHETEKQIKNK